MYVSANNFIFENLNMLHCIHFSTGASAVSFSQFGQGTGPILLDNVQCVGTEALLIDCPANPFGTHNCLHFEDAVVRCRSM